MSNQAGQQRERRGNGRRQDECRGGQPGTLPGGGAANTPHRIGPCRQRPPWILQCVTDPVFQLSHLRLRWLLAWPGPVAVRTTARRRNARAAWLFTVPGEVPMTEAIS